MELALLSTRFLALPPFPLVLYVLKIKHDKLRKCKPIPLKLNHIKINFKKLLSLSLLCRPFPKHIILSYLRNGLFITKQLMNKSKINILIADDDSDNVQMLVEVLTEIIPGFEFFRVKNGLECIYNLKSADKPDIIFLDLNIPLKSGIECLRDIKNQGLLPDTPVIVYSTSHNIKDIDAAYKYGARGYLVKPDSYGKLKQLIKIILKKLGEPLKRELEKANFVIWEKQLQS
jgi:CheY-like chemotaxis protein